MHVLSKLSKLWSSRSEPPKLPKQDCILIEDTSMYPISCEDEEQCEFVSKARGCYSENTDATSVKNLREYKKTEASSSNYEQPTINFAREKNMMTLASNNNESSSVGNISGLNDATTPSINRGFYGLEDIMVRRQHVPIKKFVDKSIQVGNGWLGSHDFAGQTSFTIEEKDVNLDEYLKGCADESYHSEDAFENVIKEFNENLKTTKDEGESQVPIEIYLNGKEADNESLSNSDMSIELEQESYQGHENLISNLASEKENQNHVHFSESCDRVNSNTEELIIDDNPIMKSFIGNLADEKEIQNHVHESCGRASSNTTELIVDDNPMMKIFIGNLADKKESQNNVHFSEPCGKVNSNTTGLIVDDNPMMISTEIQHKEVLTRDNNNVKTPKQNGKENADGFGSESIIQISKSGGITQAVATPQHKEKKKVQIISPDMTDNIDNREFNTISAEQNENSKQKICYTPAAKQRVVKSALVTPARDSGSLTCTPGTMNSNYSFRVTHDTLTKLISEVEPDQARWKEMRKIDLSTKNIESLNHLNELMPKLKELELNHNMLRYLTGTPTSLTTLQVRANRLTSLTSFAHLPNLEYLDISQNRIETLTDLHRLEHLREVFADDNLITCCYSLLRIPGLVKLSLRKNKLKSVNFELCDMRRLELLDLSENKIELIENVERLIALKALNLDNNLLRSFSATTTMPQLTYLRICYNRISELDVSPFPSLRLLWMDENRLKTIKHSETLAFLETFSARDQKGGQMYLPLKHLRDFKHIYLSGNPIKTLEPIMDFYKLEYLELAAAHIKELPHKLNQVCPSIIVLILSYNELRDFTSLRKMKRLRRLFLEGNQIYDYMAFSGVLKTLPRLKYLDLRNNPCSSNFYPTIPAISSSLVHQNSYAMHRVPEEKAEWDRRDDEFKQNLEDQWFVKRCFYRYDVFRRCPNIEWLDGSSIDPKEREWGSDLLNVDTAKILK